MGFTCLLQISTRSTDYIIDTLKLRHVLFKLNNVFTDSKIVKVFHGSESDILWLQRDFGVFVVNLFDTFKASQYLEMAGNSLAYLLDFYCGLKIDKKFQLADWRIRPLTNEMIKYAREDTHYLLYVYDRMKNTILTKGRDLMISILKASESLCLNAFKKDIYTDSSWILTFQRYNIKLNSLQVKNYLLKLDVFKTLHKWRDHVAREEDESLHYVLPNHLLFKISLNIPTEPNILLGLCSPIPPIIRLHVTDLCLLILKIVEKGVPDFEATNPLKTTQLHFDEIQDNNIYPQEVQKTVKLEHSNEDIESFGITMKLILENFVSHKISFGQGSLSSMATILETADLILNDEVSVIKNEISLLSDFHGKSDLSETDSSTDKQQSLLMENEGLKNELKRRRSNQADTISLSAKIEMKKTKLKKPKTVIPFRYSDSSIDVKPGLDPSNYNPYNEIIEDDRFLIKEKALTLKPKSGNRSMTFSKE